MQPGRLPLEAPVAPRRPHGTTNNFGDIVKEPYAWLRDDSRSNKEVLGYLEAENKYADAYFAQLQPLVDALADSMDGALPAVEVSQPNLKEGFLYYRKRGSGDDYWNMYRLPLLQQQQQQQQQQNEAAAGPAGQQGTSLAEAVRAAAETVKAAAANSNTTANSKGQDVSDRQQQQQQLAAAEQLVLDENGLSAGHTYWDVYEKEVSPDGSRVAFTYDTVGEECYSLQVLDIATGRPLLDPAVSNCAGDLTWWGEDSSTLLYTAEDRSSPDRSRLLVMGMRLHMQQQQQQQCAAQIGLLYKPEQGETGLGIKASRDGQFIILTSSLEGTTQVRVLPTSYPLAFNSSSSNSSSTSAADSSSSGGCPAGPSHLAVPLSAWQLLISSDDDLDVLSFDHVGPIGSSSSSSNSDNSGSSNSGRGRFIAIVDDDESPDGELVLVDASGAQAAGSKHGANAAIAPPPRIVSLVRNRAPAHEDSSDADSKASDQEIQQQQQQQGLGHQQENQQQLGQQEQVQQQHPKTQPQSLEILEYQVHAAAGYLAVAVRRQGVCAVDIYKLHSSSNSNSSSSSAVDADPAELTVPTVLLVTNSSNWACSVSSSVAAGSSSNNSAAAGARGTITVPNPAGTAGIAELAWVLVLDEPTLVLDLEGLAGPADDPWLMVHVSGITTPSALHYVQLNTQQQVKVYQEAIVGYQPGCYTARLEWPISDDGTAVPVTLAYRTDLMEKDGTNKALLQGYGAYGSKQWPSFNPADLALLDRGLLLAVAHVRGGGELGSAWHVHGKKFSKKNTFRDFRAAARHLVEARYTSRQGLAVWGRSAGGLTLAASLNMDPGFARVAVLDVPFLDVIATMRDPQLPLTIKERSEWGDPLNDEAAYRYISSYSPYSNIQPSATYPALLLTASLHDTRVNFWEPAKYTAAVRYYKQQQSQQLASKRHRKELPGAGASSSGTAGEDEERQQRPILLLTDMNAGHFAASAASSRLQERAMKLAFILHNLGVQAC